jgi:hypothetical protein
MTRRNRSIGPLADADGRGYHSAAPAPSGRPTSPEGNMPPMATDYDAPRPAATDLDEDSIEELTGRRDSTAQSPAVDVDDSPEAFELPGADILDEELTVAVIPMRADEFRCARCFLVHHRRNLAGQRGICQDR